MRGKAFWALLLALGLLAGARAAIVWSTEGTLTTSVVSPPLTFSLGSNADKDRYVSGASVGSNATRFAATLIGRAGGDVVTRDVFRVTGGDEAQTLTLRGQQVAGANVQILTWTVKNGTTVVATLDLRAASPATASFTLPAGTTFKLDAQIKLAKGSGTTNTEYATTTWAVIG